MARTHQLNVHAPIFVPGQLWRGKGYVERRPSQKFLRFSGNNTRWQQVMHVSAVGQPHLPRGSLYNGALGEVDSHASTFPPTVRSAFRYERRATDPDQALHKFQEVARNREKLFPRIDNTVPAVEARLVFDRWFGYDVRNLRAWQDLCFFCGHNPDDMPGSVRACKKWLRNIHINVFDLVDAVRSYRVVEPWFEDIGDLKVYSKQTGKICPSAAGDGNELFRFMLKKLF